jgi:hypothetical protein
MSWLSSEMGSSSAISAEMFQARAKFSNPILPEPVEDGSWESVRKQDREGTGEMSDGMRLW